MAHTGWPQQSAVVFGVAQEQSWHAGFHELDDIRITYQLLTAVAPTHRSNAAPPSVVMCATSTYTNWERLGTQGRRLLNIQSSHPASHCGETDDILQRASPRCQSSSNGYNPHLFDSQLMCFGLPVPHIHVPCHCHPTVISVFFVQKPGHERPFCLDSMRTIMPGGPTGKPFDHLLACVP